MAGFSLEGKRVVVVGARRSGLAAIELLLARGARVTLAEVRVVLEPAELARTGGAELELGEHRVQTFREADLVVLSPGVPLGQPALDAARAAAVPIIGEIELASRWLKGRIVAITGTKGKSTTTTLIERILREGGLDARVGGNIGAALSANVAGSTDETVHVVEISSFQLETIVTFHPAIAVFLNFSADHLDRHASIEEYATAKCRIFENQTERDWAVINADDPDVVRMARHGRARTLRFALDTPLDEGIVIAGDAIAERTGSGEVPLVPLSAVRLIGRHLVADVMAAAAVGRLFDVPSEIMTRAVTSFTGLEHALEPVAEIDGVRFVNDSKATNVAAARRAIESFQCDLVPIIGGRFKGGDLRDLRALLAGRAVAVVAIGESRDLVTDAFADLLPVHRASSMKEAVERAFAAAPRGGTVLLAPACASFDMFADYAERGRVFKQEVARLQEHEQ
ncbi:MAG: UDP-N-acetylmuramoyl-L-alanine--D-glutamate ligase [Acidobacteria bacterium]|nr:UDP-N-acetylmuramoyl-L-alanine--D-glutamate ligase [Acidobacteriota bacterium]